VAREPRSGAEEDGPERRHLAGFRPDRLPDRCRLRGFGVCRRDGGATTALF